MTGTDHSEKVGANVGEVFGNSGDSNVVAGDAEPEATLGEVESEAEAEDEDNGSGPDEGRTTIFRDKKDGGFGGVVEGDGPLFVEGVGRSANVEAADGFITGGGSARCADADDEERVGDLWKLEAGSVGKEDGECKGCSGDGNATSEVYLETLGGAGLVENDRLGADKTAASVTDGEGDGGDERGLVENDAIVGKRVVDAQVVTASNELAVTVDAEVGDVVGGEAGIAVEGGSEVVDAEADVVGSAARVDNGALPGGEGLIEGETGEAVAEVNKRGGEDTAGRTVCREAVPLGEDASNEESNKGGVKDEGGEGGPGVFIGIEIGDGFIIVADNGTDVVMAFAQFPGGEDHRVGMVACGAFEGVLIEFLAAADNRMSEVLPDSGDAVERADDDAKNENTE